ncbi:MAG: FKBP-type peptidyl-prolyl cis-trans isomerase [Balneolaceae bacterium]
MRLKKFKTFTFVATLFLFVVSCGSGKNPYFFEDDLTTVPEPFSTAGITPIVQDDGLKVYVLKEGSGPYTVTNRDDVLVFYTGRRANGKVFDSSYKNGSQSASQLSVNGVIDGFRQGLLGMKEGGKKVLVIPPDLGYGNSGHTLSKDTLIFDIELSMIVK